MEVVIFGINNAVKVIFPAPDCGLSMLEIGQKDVPDGIDFWIIDVNDLPDEPIEAWELDAEALGLAAGTGGTYQTKDKQNDKSE